MATVSVAEGWAPLRDVSVADQLSTPQSAPFCVPSGAPPEGDARLHCLGG